jgi:elongation factor Ts
MNDIKKLRSITGAGMLDCSNALKESNGDIDEAVSMLRKKGLAKAAKKMDRPTSEGVLSLALSKDLDKYSIISLSCETDFVAKNSAFIDSADRISAKGIKSSATNIEEFKNDSIDNTTVEDYVKSLINSFGENIVLGLFENISSTNHFEYYKHSNNKLAVVVEFEGSMDKRDVVKNVAMHIAAMSPAFLDSNSVDSETLVREKEIYQAELKDSGKSQSVIDKIVEGKVNKYLEASCLLYQKFVKDNNLTVSEYVSSNDVKIISFKRYILGE